ncbi:MAG: acyltransferase family protein [Acidimicrobiales bacterium]
MTEPARSKIKHRPLLDGTRGVMMCVVLGYHLDGFTKLPGAWVSMDFFFVLSGFLITTLLIKEHAERDRVDLREFVRRRVRRLAPALLVVLTAVFLIAWALGIDDYPTLRGDGLATLFYVANWRFILSQQSYFASFGVSPLRHAWSLAIEEQFYLVWPVCFALLARWFRGDRRKLAVVLVAATIASALWMRHLSLGDVDLSRAYFGTDTRGQGLLVGALLALLLWRERFDSPKAKEFAAWFGTVALAGLVAMMLLFHDDSRAVYTSGGFVLIAVASAAFTFGCARAERGPLAWIFGNRVSRHFGHVSYSFYLWHWPIIVFLSPERVGWSPAVLDSARVAISLVLAELTHRFVELPIHQGRVQIRRPLPTFGGAFAASCVVLLVVTMGVTSSTPPVTGTQQSGAETASAPTVLVAGDSLAWLLSGTAPSDLPFKVEGIFQAHCDLIGERIYTGDSIDEADPACETWPDRWNEALTAGLDGVHPDPDAVLVSFGLRQLFDIDDDGTRIVVGSPEWEEAYRSAVAKPIEIIRSHTDAPVFWLDVPCYQWRRPRAPARSAIPSASTR